jgi:hypothetical protein
VNLRLIAPKRRNVGNPWFKRGTLARAVIDTLRRSAVPMKTREISDALFGREEARGHAPSSYGAGGMERGQYPPAGAGRNRPSANAKQASEQRNTNVAIRTDGAGIGV